MIDAIKILMKYISDESLSLYDLYKSSNIASILPAEVLDALKTINSALDSRLLYMVNDRVLITDVYAGENWYKVLKELKHACRLKSNRFQVYSFKLGSITLYFFNIRGSHPERLVYTVCNS